jgi:adenylate kinase family enzyme
MKIFIAGIPGTGKTTIGNTLERDHGFKHINLEGSDFEEFRNNQNKTVNEWVSSKENIIISWGFAPQDFVTEVVLKLKSNEFKFIWFDGNRDAARKAFNNRGDVSEELLNVQLERIDNYDVIGKMNPVIYNTFQENGEFKKKEVIIQDLLAIK